MLVFSPVSEDVIVYPLRDNLSADTGNWPSDKLLLQIPGPESGCEIFWPLGAAKKIVNTT